MSVLLVAGEDIDFPDGGVVGVNTTANGFNFRTGYARCGIYNAGSNPTTKQFAGGARTSYWVSWRQCFGSYGTSSGLFGIGGKKGILAGLLFAVHNTQNGKISLWTRNNSGTWAIIASEAGFSMNGSINNRFDCQIVNYGASGTVNLYMNGTLILSYTGDLTAGTGNTSLDSCFLINANPNHISEVIVADEDTRTMPGVVTLAITGVGTTDAWSGTITNVNGTSFSDANPVSSNTTGQDEQANVTDLPSITALIKCVAQTIRAAVSASPTASKIALGYNNGGTVAVGSDITPTTSYDTYQQIDAVDPTTSAAFLQSAMNALQLNARSRP